MIVSIWKPKIVSKEIKYYTLCKVNDLYSRNSQKFRIIYRCDGENCKTPERVYSIDRHHLSIKRSKTVNENLQVCRSCQMSGNKNPRYNDNRTWEELVGKDRSDSLKKELIDRLKGEKNPSKKDETKLKKNQIVINFDNVSIILNKLNLKLNSIDGDNKFARLSIVCDKGHQFNLKWSSMKSRKNICRYCYYESIRIPLSEIKKFETYSRTVRSFTRFTFLKHKNLIDKDGLKELNSKKYHIDHIYSIVDGFINKVDPKIIASVNNLRVMDGHCNLKKGRKSEMSLENLIEMNNRVN